MRGASHPHPGGPYAALDEAGTAMTLSMLVADTAREIGTVRAASASWATLIRAAADPGLREVWDQASDGGRRDVLTAVAEMAARAGVDPAGLEPVEAPAGVDDDPLMRQAGQYARALVELAGLELAAPGREPDLSLLPEAPWLPALGPTGIVAMSVVCDSTEPEDAKLTAAVALSAAAQQASGGAR